MFIVFYRVILLNSSSKASRLLFIFIHVNMGHAHFQNNEIRIPWMPMRPGTLFFGCRTPEKLTRKAGIEICVRLGEKHTVEAELTCV